MSNLVVWSLLAPLLLKAVDKIVKDPLESAELERMGENHPLTLYTERYLMQTYKPNGGLTCPELEKILSRNLKENPQAVEKLVYEIVKSYYSMRKKYSKPRGRGALIYV